MCDLPEGMRIDYTFWELNSDDESEVVIYEPEFDLLGAFHQAELDPNDGVWANPAYVDKPVLHDNTTGVINVSAFESQSGPSPYLLIDTGASDHIIFDARCIVDPALHKSCNVVINTGNGVSPVQSRGPATFIVNAIEGGQTVTYEFTRTVMYSPNFKVNLFSPGSDWLEHKTVVRYEPELVIKLADGIDIPFSSVARCYHLAFAPPSLAIAAASTTSAQRANISIDESGAVRIEGDVPQRLSEDANLWHRRLAHTSYGQLKEIQSQTRGR